MHYEDLPPRARSELELSLCSDNPADRVEALLSAALHEPDVAWVAGLCVENLQDQRFPLRCAALTAMSHLARRQAPLDLRVILPLLNELSRDDALTGRVSDVRDDLTHIGYSANTPNHGCQ